MGSLGPSEFITTKLTETLALGGVLVLRLKTATPLRKFQSAEFPNGPLKTWTWKEKVFVPLRPSKVICTASEIFNSRDVEKSNCNTFLTDAEGVLCLMDPLRNPAMSNGRSLFVPVTISEGEITTPVVAIVTEGAFC